MSEKKSWSNHKRLPEWLKARLPKNKKFFELKSLVQKYNLNTVCESASCPNIGECWDAGTLTFMILGDTCTRSCGFCAVKTGFGGSIDHLEPKRLAKGIENLKLNNSKIKKPKIQNTHKKKTLQLENPQLLENFNS